MESISSITKKENKPAVPEHLKDLPAEVLQNLSTNYRKGLRAISNDEIGDSLIKIMQREEDRSWSVDDFLVELYRQHKLVIKRNPLMSHLQRLEKKGVLVRPTTRIYKLNPKINQR